jgi:two-component system nitrate/nitrite response regulator NarL
MQNSFAVSAPAHIKCFKYQNKGIFRFKFALLFIPVGRKLCLPSSKNRVRYLRIKSSRLWIGYVTMSTDITIPTYIIQSDDLFREGLRLFLSTTCFRPQGCAVAPDELTEVPCDRTALFIIGANQAESCRKIRNQYPLALIVAMADESESRSLAAALENGANAALFSSVSPNALVSTLRALVDGKLVLIDARLWSREIQPAADERPPSLPQNRASPPLQNDAAWDAAYEPHALKQLSPREIAILARLVQGDSNKHIARLFRITEPTVKAHVKGILRKTGANNRTQAAIWALNHKLLDDDVNEADQALPMVLHHETSH